MDQVKIGKFISEKRKEAGLTQAQLAEKLGITDRAVSKWETGRSLPDAAIMMDLCVVLKITVNDLLSGEEVSMENYNKKTDKVLIEMVRQKEEADKRLLSLEVVIGVISTVFLFVMVLLGAYLQVLKAPVWVTVVLIAVGFVQFIIAVAFALKIEQVAGYYECPECGFRYVPSLSAVNLAPHLGRTRRMKCPNCGKKAWQKKVISKE
ncbi:MAG: helix-turn-helix domain-containing protein [Clostridia bacterium]|nr:helix-turn-helix domain-containing protein [Clostridia bacterium]